MTRILKRFFFLPVLMVAVTAVSLSALRDESAPVSKVAPDPQAALSKGVEFELVERWEDAVVCYETALRKFPDDQGLTYALRRARIQMSITRRYLDDSYQAMLKASDKEAAARLLVEVFDKISTGYLNSISITRFTAHGTESLYMALVNSRFVNDNVRPDLANNVASVRSVLLEQYWNREVASVPAAQKLMLQIVDLCQKRLGIPFQAVLLEYIFGGVNCLDANSMLLTVDQYRSLNLQVHGNLVGIGISIRADGDKGILLERVFAGGPASEGGLQGGDHIVAINGQDCVGVTTDEAATLLRGLPGSKIRLTYTTVDNKQFTQTLERRQFNVPSVTQAEMLDETRGIGYIRMEHFQDNTLNELDEAIRDLRTRGMKSLVWDLRGNPGGQLDVAYWVADRFIDQGVIVRTRGRGVQDSEVMTAGQLESYLFPLVLLVDENSASASEIIAGAIRDHNRGVIVGRRTYGKWSVQTILPLMSQRGMALKMTTAQFYSPADRSYPGKGLDPDVDVPVDEGATTLFFRPRKGQELIADPDVSEAMSALRRGLAGVGR